MTKKDIQAIAELLGWENRLGDLQRTVDKHDVALGYDREDDVHMENRVRALELKTQRQVTYIKILSGTITFIISGLITLIASGHIGPILRYFMGLK